MYTIEAMILPGYAFTPAEMFDLAKLAVKTGVVTIEDDQIIVTHGESTIFINHDDDAHVGEECDELASADGFPCAGCTERYEIEGDTPDMSLANDFAAIGHALKKTGKFFVYDTADGTEFSN